VREPADFRAWSLGGVPVLSVPAEVDIANADGLLSIIESVSTGQPVVVVDMSETTFCDSSALQMLVHASQRMLDRGAELRLVCSSSVVQLMAITGADQLYSIFTSLPEAVARPARSAAG
jgi:anti-anti-sigma factor